ncbi:sensor histidine kinase [Tessaracoccus sp. HDW20]|uniref:ATP-binding protein n=1 Tax=Tessaracoccus coleopterorum TaxID=2714950 RepID=UPI0018D2CDA1|nr:ATP-binding protein [Tessaracoccus coleopterorum]NHB84000.1 sensor histidine kinase [Tessaracoccus coleopterorum]
MDLAAALDKYASARVTVSTMASLVMAPRRLVDEVERTLAEILMNVEKHAGPDAKVWILLDQELDDEVILWVRDNGHGMSAAQLQEATDKGRLGIRDSIVGRMDDLGDPRS